ncbi:ImuA family protein [Pseudopelagicola sp. nBUS_19]|uniref:ImuA family protein n=1 Tax=Pseudopelagicola sp. nBUS_19 TaxID=3395316 RepID=UPI003EBF6EA8
MVNHLLKRAHERQRPILEPAPGIGLALSRLHEACGPARYTFALWLAHHTRGPVFWIAPNWSAAPLNPDGMTQFVNPGRFTFITPRRSEELLWTMEETLRAGLVPLVVADLPGLPALTPVRRLHIAAETSMRETGQTPLGLILTPSNGGAQGVESRWHMAQAHSAEEDAWTLTRLRARTDPIKCWKVTGLPQKPQLASYSAKIKTT